MPRQQIAYMVPEPLEPLNLEEVKFWLRIMQEHALFINAGLPCDQTDLIDEAQAFNQEFGSLRTRAESVKNDKKFTELISNSHVLVKEFCAYKRKLLHMMLECKLGGWNFPLLLDHMAREAEYFMRLLDKIKCAKETVNGGTKALENVFWLRIMADHAKFISHLLDPSERNLIDTANAFAEEFDNLFLQGRDFSSMLHCYHEVSSFKRFMQDVRAATVRLRDFKRAAEEMIVECRLVGLIPAQLADHVRREADHFLMLLNMMEKCIMKNMPIVPIDDMDDIILPAQDIHKKCKVYKVMKPEREDYQDEREEEEEQEEEQEEQDEEERQDDAPATDQADMEWMVQDKINSKINAKNESKDDSPEPKNTVIEEAIIVAEPKTSDAKYKWSGKWPRQLGNKSE